MLRATSVRAATTWREAAADSVVLEFDDRHRRRMVMTGTRGLEFLLDLPEVVVLRGGDALVLEDGRLVEVVAAAEPLLEIRSHDPHLLVRVAWHLGNRHLPVQLAGRHLRIRRDHVIEDMVKGLGARIVEVEAPFDPEGGAYLGGHGEASHEHSHDSHSHRHHDHHDHAHDDHAHGHHDHHHDHHHHDDHSHHDHGRHHKHGS